MPQTVSVVIPALNEAPVIARAVRSALAAGAEGPVVVSPRRWQQGGLARTWASWLVIQTLYFCNVSPWGLARLYRHIR